MNVATQMLEARPDERGVDHAALALAIDSLQDAGAAAVACADACLSTPDPSDLVDCIRACQDTADVAAALCRVLARTGPTVQGSRALVDATSKMLSECSEACSEHGERHKHCRITAEATSRAEQALAGLQTAIASAEASTDGA